MKRALWIVAAIVIALVILNQASVREGYSGVCIRCLQGVSGTDHTFFGIRWLHEEHLTSGGGGLMSPAIFGPKVPKGGSRTYEEIFGVPCDHQIVRTGFCRYSGGTVGCGSYGGGQEYELRIALLQNLFAAFHRVPDRQLAQETYALIDKLYPHVNRGERIERPMRSVYEADVLPNEPLSILLRGLALAHSIDDWKSVLTAAQTKNGHIALLEDQGVLSERLKDTDPLTRKQALDSLAAQNNAHGWAVIASILDDPNDQLGNEAARQILWNRRFELFDRVLSWETPRGYTYEPDEIHRSIDRADLSQFLTDQDIKTLLTQKKPRIDELCFEAIKAKDRFQFLPQVLEILNDRPSQEAKDTIHYLIEGPAPDYFREEKTHQQPVSQWNRVREEHKHLIGIKAAPNNRPDELLWRAVNIDTTKPSDDAWTAMKDVFEDWIIEGGVGVYSAAFAEAMYAIDPAKTVEYLNTRLGTSGDNSGNQAYHVLSGMGAIGVPDFLPALEEFVRRSKGGNYDTNGFYRQHVDYALHRCRQINRWKLVSNSEGGGKYAILRVDGTFIR
jgi:hypothetical protein